MTKINDNYSNLINSKTANPITSEVSKKEDSDKVSLSDVDNKTSNNSNIYKNMGVDIKSSKTFAGVTSNSTNPKLEKAIEYYNNEMDYYQRYSITRQTYTNIEKLLYNMEHGIDLAYQDCDAYSDIMIMPRWHYRFYPNFEDKLLNFNIDEIRERTEKDMNSLHKLKDDVEYIIEKANGQTEHKEPAKTEYDVDELAQKHLGMSYSEFAEKYKDELEFCKTVTYSDLNSMNETQRFVYAKAKAYAKDMLTITINEAHTVNWDIGRRKVEETTKATDDMIAISDLEYDGINEQSLSQIHSNIALNALETALIDSYTGFVPTEIKETEGVKPQQKPFKCTINGTILIFNPDGSVYDLNGKRIK